MLKSRGRTGDIPVMGVEGWPQVVFKYHTLFDRNEDYEYDKKGRSIQE